jgi:capsular exopolysaccharide synthesis family protein
MGRVYKALAKNWKEQARQPQPQEASRIPSPQIEVEPVNLADAQSDIVYGLGLAGQESSVDFYTPVMPVNFNVEDELPILRDEAASRESQINDWSYEPRRLQVAPIAPLLKPTVVFTEPGAVFNAGNLAIEPHLVAINGSDVLASERYRTLAVRLLNMVSQNNKKTKTLLITSAREGEGKTTVATNLAWVMAKPGERRVLLIDAHIQNSSVCAKLNLNPQCGWLDVVDGNSKLVDTAIRLDPNGLYVMSPRKMENGSTNTVPSDVLTSSRVEKLFKELEQYFDFILIDAPPILDSADAQRIASIVDGTVMVTRAGHTNHTAVTDALKLIPKERRLGIVLNEAQVEEEATGRRRKQAKAK